MSKWDKLLSRILSLSKDMRFDELRKQPLHFSKAGKKSDHDSKT